MKTRALRISEVCRITGLARSTIYGMMAKNRFPRPVHLAGGRAARWLEHEVTEYLQARAAERDGTGGGHAQK